ncbi:hypothetical protein QB964_004331 [Salmonella enterica]|nr:hypothetical protein [Salmonella enterica]
MGILEQEMKRLAQQAGGSYKTVDDRIRLAQRFCERLVLAQNVQIRRVEQLKARHIEGYIRERLAQGVSEKEALAMTAMDLGHGDGRGRYVAQVYGREMKRIDSLELAI